MPVDLHGELSMSRPPIYRQTGAAFAFNLTPQGVPEPPVSNRQFLLSLREYGIWLRVLGAEDHLRTLRLPESERVQRIASLAGFYHQLGSQMEDIESLFLALAAWKLDRNLLIVDLLERIVLKSDGI